MRILLLADIESEYLWDYFEKEKLEGVDLILSAGDLKAEYLSFLVTFSHVPLLYIRGNHDGHYDVKPPEGCDCIEDQIVEYHGFKILGLGGCIRYKPDDPDMYTERQMAWRINRKKLSIQRAGGVDLLLAHAPARGIGDADDLPHRGYECFVKFLDHYEPAYMVHGHVHANYQRHFDRERTYHKTRVINAYERYMLDIPDRPYTKDGLIWHTKRKEKKEDESEPIFLGPGGHIYKPGE